jgi:tRNA threonylcarbamoyladenosine modification (KEOPS) complex  Pcc1 subunit
LSSCAKASIRLKLQSEKQAETLFSALKPEADAPPTHRSSVKLQKEGAYLILMAEAEDTVALRATLNAYLRWINSILNVMDVIQ